MPRHRPRLGQGLEALVSPLRTDPPAEPAELPPPPEIPVPVSPRPLLTAWEYAFVQRAGRRKARRGCRVTVLSGDLVRKPRRRRLRGLTPLAALGVLGANGWELVAIRGRKYVLKRPELSSAPGGGLRVRYLA